MSGMEKPPRPREGVLIDQARIRKGLSVRQLAPKVGLSEARVRQIINGYASAGRGQSVAVQAPADRVARMAEVLDIDAEQLEEAGRGDAAAVLHRWSTMSPEERDRDPVRDAINESSLRRQDKELLLAQLDVMRRRRDVDSDHETGDPGESHRGA